MHRRRFLQSALASTLLTETRAASVQQASPRLLVVDSVGSALEFVDARTFAREGRVALGKRPREIALSPDGSVVYVSIYGPGVYGQNPTPGHEIAAIDVRSKRLIRKMEIGPHSAPHGMAVAANGLLWVTCETEGALLLVDPAARSRAKTIVSTVALGVKGPHWLVMTPDGSKIYAANKDRPVLSVIDTSARKLLTEIRVPGGLEGLTITPDGRRLFAASLGRAVLWIIDTSKDLPVREHLLDEAAGRLLATPDGRCLMVSHYESGSLEVLELPSLHRRGVVKIGRSPSGLATSNDSLTGYVASWAGGTVSVVDLNSLRVLRNVEIGGGPDGLAVVTASAG